MVESAEGLAAECSALVHYLVGQPATAPMQAYYARAHATIPYRKGGPLAAVDDPLVSAIASGGVILRAADAYARFFRPTGPLRQKVTLVLAIVENSPETHAALNRAAVGPRWRVLTDVALAGVGFLLCLGLGLLVFGPQQLTSGRTREPAGA